MSIDTTRTTRNYHAHGGNEWVVGGTLTILEGATVTGLAATAAAASAGARGGIKAAAKGDQDTVEAKIGADDKLYVPAYPEAYALPPATAGALGGVKALLSQPDSAATTIAELKGDFNELLGKLRAAGLMQEGVEGT